MISMHIILDGEGVWPDLHDRPVIHLANDAPPIQVAVLDSGMSSGRPSVALRIELPDGTRVLAETSARLFCSAARAIEGRFPDLFRDDA